jgi:hypothetical protein
MDDLWPSSAFLAGLLGNYAATGICTDPARMQSAYTNRHVEPRYRTIDPTKQLTGLALKLLAVGMLAGKP